MKKPVLTAFIHLVYLSPCLAQALPGKDRDSALTGRKPLVTLVSPLLLNPAPGAAPVSVVIRVANNQTAWDLANMYMEWQVLVNGQPGQKGTIANLPPGPRQAANFRLPVRIPPGPKNEIFINLRYRLKKKSSKPAGQLPAMDQPLGSDQLLLRPAYPNDCTVRPDGELTFTDENGLFTISAAACNLQFNKQNGWLLHYAVKGNSLLDEEKGLRPDFWQEPRLQLFSTSTASNIAVVSADYSFPESFYLLHIRYTINAYGEIQVAQSLEVDSMQLTNNNGPRDSLQKDTTLPRFGMQWTMPAGLDSVTWYGRGPAGIGIYPGLLPQTDNWTDLRWWKISGKKGMGLLITADSSLLTLNLAQSRQGIQLNIDKPGNHLPFGNYHYIYKISPL